MEERHLRALGVRPQQRLDQDGRSGRGRVVERQLLVLVLPRRDLRPHGKQHKDLARSFPREYLT